MLRACLTTTSSSDLTPLPGKQTGAEVTKLVGLMQRLLAPDGCPWDREQTLETLVPYLVEETYEVVDALAGGDADDHREELGDLLLQIAFQSELRVRRGEVRHRRRRARHRRQAGAPPSARVWRRGGQGRRRGARQLGQAEGGREGREGEARRARRRPQERAGAAARHPHRREGGRGRLRLARRRGAARQGRRGAARIRRGPPRRRSRGDAARARRSAVRRR